MSIQAQLDRIETQNKRIERQLEVLARPKPVWVPASTIIDLTGWDKNKMFTARKNETIKYKQRAGSFLYDLTSLHPTLIKNK